MNVQLLTSVIGCEIAVENLQQAVKRAQGQLASINDNISRADAFIENFQNQKARLQADLATSNSRLLQIDEGSIRHQKELEIIKIIEDTIFRLDVDYRNRVVSTLTLASQAEAKNLEISALQASLQQVIDRRDVLQG